MSADISNISVKKYVDKIFPITNKRGVKNGFNSIYNSKFNNVNSININTLYQKLLTINNYPNEKNVYNKMFQKAVNDIQFFLSQDETFFDIKLALIKIKCENSIMFSRLDNINKRFFGDKLTFSYKNYIIYYFVI